MAMDKQQYIFKCDELRKVLPFDWEPYHCRPDHLEWHANPGDGQGRSSLQVEASLYPDDRHRIAVVCTDLEETLAHGDYSPSWELAWESAAEELRAMAVACASAMHDLYFYRRDR
jgi:hypothetical protein